ncbi:vWA domain-containing protein [Halomonas sp. DQ26W]|uniref:VWA domain-containing protein n=1 Tax=Halomonas sp. DQ26W TaxID=2282311 RepID=UPI0015EFF209|nr:vWA domain-containing protein [Halomonas sp. DQ26W]
MDERPDVRVIIDVSGSMYHNDPEQLAAEALELLVALLPSGARAGVWTFGERVENPLPPGPVNPEWREQAMALAPELVEYQQFTDIESAIRDASAPEANGTRHLVLLTDGVIDLPPRYGAKPGIDDVSRRTLLESVGPRLAVEEVAIHAVAFSGEADLDLVERLSQQTGGLSAPVESPDALLGAFLNVFDRIFPSDRLPLTDDQFLVEPGLDGFTALLFHEGAGETDGRERSPPVLIAPDGSRFTVDSPPEGATWRSESRYDLVQVPSPMPGQWRLEGGVDKDSRITIASALSLQTSGVPGTFYLGFDVPLEAWLTDEGEMVSQDALPAHLEMSALLHDDTGSTQSAVVLERQDERFTGTLPAPALTGTAQLVIRAEGQGFRRQRIQAVNVLPAIVARHEEENDRVVLTAEHPFLDHDNTRLHGQLQGERLDAEPQTTRHWMIGLPALDRGLSQPLLLRAEVTLDGETRELRLPRLLLFPQGEITIDQAAAPTMLGIERFHEELDPVRESTSSASQPGNMDRLVTLMERFPRLAQSRWNDWRPVVERKLEAGRHDPRIWGLALLVVALLLLGLVWRRRQRRMRRRRVTTKRREEPHV